MSILQIKTPRVFLPLLGAARYKGAHGGRGSGKSHFFAELLIETALTRKTRAVCIREIQKSITQSVKLLLEDKIKALGLGSKFRVLDDRIETPHDGLIIFQGMQNHTAESIKSLEGFDVAWLAEAQSISQRSLDLLRPTIRKEGSEIWADWNPETPDVPIDLLLRGPNKLTDAIVVEANWRSNPFFPEVLMREMEEDKRRDYEKYLHVWEGHYKIALEGAVYKNELLKATEEKRITRVPYDATKPVLTFWDLGWADSTSIWFAQPYAMEYRIIDHYRNNQQALPHYLQVLQQRGYVYGTDFLPHDAQARQMGTGRSVEELLRAAGRDVQIVPQLSVADGINAARTIFGQCWFDAEKCADGLKALRHYRYEIDDESGAFSRKPLHDWASHDADAFRCLAVAIQQQTKPRAAKPRAASGWMG